jgi:hypothetical protein
VNLGGVLGNLTFANIVGGLLFSSIGFAAFTIGKRTMNTRLMMLGVALMLYCFFITDTFWMYVAGSGLTAAAYMSRNDS